MKYVLSPHAKDRMEEREISDKIVKNALQNPTKISYNSKNRILIKKLYRRKNKRRLLLIAGEMEENHLRIITIIDTSKVRKYL